MQFSKEELEGRRPVTLYVVYTTIYIPIVLLTLYLTGGILTMGKFSFLSALIVFIFTEMTKFLASSIYYKKNDLITSGKIEEFNALLLVKSFFTKNKLKEGCKTVFTVLVMTAVFFIMSILYGAEIFSKHEETLMFSSLLSILTIFPICLNVSPSAVLSAFLSAKPNHKMELLMYRNLYMAILGAWIGGIVIPLDWDRPWQQWPIPCSIGALVGFFMSHFLAFFYILYGSLTGKHIS